MSQKGGTRKRVEKGQPHHALKGCCAAAATLQNQRERGKQQSDRCPVTHEERDSQQQSKWNAGTGVIEQGNHVGMGSGSGSGWAGQL